MPDRDFLSSGFAKGWRTPSRMFIANGACPEVVDAVQRTLAKSLRGEPLVLEMGDSVEGALRFRIERCLFGPTKLARLKSAGIDELVRTEAALLNALAPALLHFAAQIAECRPIRARGMRRLSSEASLAFSLPTA
jgi:hypothetical protein